MALNTGWDTGAFGKELSTESARRGRSSGEDLERPDVYGELQSSFSDSFVVLPESPISSAKNTNPENLLNLASRKLSAEFH